MNRIRVQKETRDEGRLVARNEKGRLSQQSGDRMWRPVHWTLLE